MKQSSLICFAVLFFLLAVPFGVILAQDADVDPMGFVGIVFSPAIAIMVGAIVGFTKIVRNTINLKGPLAVVVTVVVSFGYSLMQYSSSEGIGTAILVGAVASLASTLGFRATKWFGKKVVNPAGTK